MSIAEDVKCMFCGVDLPKYNCPRCLAHYCSVKCFQHKSHHHCSEEFYKEQVLDELKDMRGSREERNRMLDLLKRVHQGDSGGYEVTDLAHRLGDVDLEDTDSVWEKLTQQEREMFQKSVSEGNMHFLPVWTPWWSREETKIEEVSPKSSQRTVPKILKDLPKLGEVLPDKSPDPNLRFCLIEILLSYCCMQRVFIGDLYDSPSETISLLFYLSKVISDNKIFSDVDSCIHCFIDNVTRDPDLHIDPIQDCLQDVYQIIASKDSFVQRVLSDFYNFLKKCSKHMRNGNQQLSRRLFVASKKVYFYLIYSVAYEGEIKKLLAPIGINRGILLKERGLVKEQRELIEENYEKLKPSVKKRLIEEL